MPDHDHGHSDTRLICRSIELLTEEVRLFREQAIGSEEDRAILSKLLVRSERIAKKLEKLDALTPKQ